ncbi:glucosyltransferase domain-containing protein [Pseudomonas nitroreducens]|uniref:glucosyltransferase domain-containing protein n=1 Tax=Pseudomonas nitroreducens TaxID=46680 RepID=UPI002657D320|nr:glucosyltransferase domain-containing protein [Pseudomonas nitroreducens]MCP1650791.1 hypothetical protein [Pseudomonas nitroreducens]MCP1688743.1 hypothetical protein [Pseudomonas nitroreducens]
MLTPISLKSKQLDLIKVTSTILLATIISKGTALFLGYSSDDYSLSRKDAGLNFFLGQGRYTEALIQKLTSKMGLHWTDIYFTNTALLFICYSALISISVLALRDKNQSITTPIIGGVIIATHPYFSALLLFREASVNTLFCLIALFLFVRLWLSTIDSPSKSGGKSLLAAVALCAAIGCYQPALCIALCITIPITVQRVFLSGSTTSSRTWALTRAATPLVLATIGYIAINASIKTISDINLEKRNQLIDPSDIPERLTATQNLLSELIISGTPISPELLTILQGVLLIAGILCANRKNLPSAISAFLLYPILVLISIVPFTLSQVWWPVHRAMASIGFSLGLLAILSISSAHRFQNILAVGWLFLSWGLAMHSSAMFIDQIRLNRWDFSRAQLIIHEVKRQFPDVTDPAIRIVNNQWAYPIPLASSISDHGISAFSVPWAVTEMMQEATGQNIQRVELQQTDSDICQGSRRWPGQDSLHLVEGVVYVCL